MACGRADVHLEMETYFPPEWEWVDGFHSINFQERVGDEDRGAGSAVSRMLSRRSAKEPVAGSRFVVVPSIGA